MLRFAIFLTAFFSSHIPVLASEWPESVKLQMDAIGARLGVAETAADRVDAIREIEVIVAAHPDAPDARLMARLLSQQATIEAGPGAMLDALNKLAASGQISDAESFAGIAGPLIGAIADMQDDAPLLGSVAIELNDAVSKLNATAAKAGLPSVADAISQFTGDKKLGSAMTNFLSRISSVAKLARDAPNLAEFDEKMTKEFIANSLKIMSRASAVAVNPVGVSMFSSQVVWSSQMYGEATKAMNLIADAMETGEVNPKEFNKVVQTIEVLASGPWNSDTAKDILKSLCKTIPVAKAWCKDLFKLADKLISVSDCSAMTCDCENVGGGLSFGPRYTKCKWKEQELILQCTATGSVTSQCLGHARGPGANR